MLGDLVNKIRQALPQNKKRLVALVFILLAIPLTIVLVLTQQNYRNFASGADVSYVAIHPGAITSSVGEESTHLSALAYDSSGNPVDAGVTYEWSMSSTNSVGTLSEAQGDLSEFTPLAAGCGQITVIVRGGTQDVTKSTAVAVSDGTSVPDCSVVSVPTLTSTPPAGTASRMFITRNTYKGNLGGLDGADAKCQTSADTVGLGGNWKAWISDSTTSAESRLNHSNSNYVLLNGTKIADNWNDLVDGSIDAKINIDEYKNPNVAFDSYTWTSTFETGKSLNWANCSNWTSSEQSNSTNAYVGHAQSTDKSWSVKNQFACSNNFNLYCIEQVEVSTPTPTSTSISPTATSIPLPTKTPTPVPPTPVPPTPTVTKTPPPTFTPVPQVLKTNIRAIADSYVRSNKPKKNYGKKIFLATYNNPSIISYMKFNLGSMANKDIKKATLKFKVVKKFKKLGAKSRATQSLRLVDSSWTERGITYKNRPPSGILVTTFVGNKYNQVIEIDVTSVVRENNGGFVSFSIDSNKRDLLAIYSRESRNTKPKLIIEYTN